MNLHIPLKPTVCKKSSFLHNVKQYRWQYIMILPGIVCLILFSYIPITGLQVAFKDFQLGSTIWGSPWNGLVNFNFFDQIDFWKAVRNTLIITILKFLFNFITPVILALLLNEIRSLRYKRIIQTVSYLPHFVSWIVVAYLLDALLSPGALVNQVITSLGLKSVYFLGDPALFRPIIVTSSVWKEIGWGSIIYLAAISSIDQEMYEAAYMEGAGRWNQARHITLPCLVPTILLLLILQIPNLLNAGYEQIYPLMNGANMEVSDVIDTYVIRTGLQQGYFGQAAAVGMVSSIIAFILIFSTNAIAKKANGEGLW